MRFDAIHCFYVKSFIINLKKHNIPFPRMFQSYTGIKRFILIAAVVTNSYNVGQSENVTLHTRTIISTFNVQLSCYNI